MSDLLDTLVVGGGISGLTTAFNLRRAGRAVAVVEAAERVGGAMSTERADGWIFELGPNTVVENNPAVGTLIEQAGLAGEKLVANPDAKRRFMWKDDRVIPLPGGALGFVTTPLFSMAGKLRIFGEPFAAKPPGREESIAEFVRRRLGQEMLDYAVGPFVSGVYAGDPERLSVQYAVPKIYALERDHGGLIKGAFAKRKGPQPGGEMISFRNGLDTLPRRLAELVGDVRTGWAATALRRDGDAWVVEGPGETLRARRLLLNVGADAVARLLNPLTGGRAAAFADLPYSPVSVMSFGVRREDVAHPMNGFGFLAPRRESLRILGCLFPSTIFPGRAPAGHAVLTCFMGGRTDPGAAALGPAGTRELVLAELRRSVGFRGEPVKEVFRSWPRAIPQYDVGHGRFLALADGLEKELPGLYLGGNMLRGVSVADCIRNAFAMGERLLAA